ncbi:MAG TPA: hypothetical protein VMV92_27570, partial [Streptosporangiaceae bacterium]|nr:hypothetical protein [Streptosporangiaceae bacterium]
AIIGHTAVLLTRNQFADAVLVGAALAITAYRGGSSLTAAGEFARIAVALTSLRIRDDAWALWTPEPGRPRPAVDRRVPPRRPGPDTRSYSPRMRSGSRVG